MRRRRWLETWNTGAVNIVALKLLKNLLLRKSMTQPVNLTLSALKVQPSIHILRWGTYDQPTRLHSMADALNPAPSAGTQRPCCKPSSEHCAAAHCCVHMFAASHELTLIQLFQTRKGASKRSCTCSFLLLVVCQLTKFGSSMCQTSSWIVGDYRTNSAKLSCFAENIAYAMFISDDTEENLSLGSWQIYPLMLPGSVTTV